MSLEINPCWVLKGNIVSTRTRDGQVLSGTRLFRPNAKVFLATLDHNWAVLEPRKVESIQVLGQHRKSRKWVVSYLCSTYVENWRIGCEYNPLVTKRLKKEEWPGFDLEFSCDEGERKQENSIRELIQALIKAENASFFKDQ